MDIALKIFNLLFTVSEWALAKSEEKKAELRAKADKQYNELFDFMEGTDERYDADLAAARTKLAERFPATPSAPAVDHSGVTHPAPVDPSKPSESDPGDEILE